jgi:hypothetical protein
VPNPVEVSHVVARYPGTLTPAQQVNAEAYLSDIWSIVLSRRPLIEDYMTATTVPTSEVIRVVSNAVVRKLLNPEGKSEESIDDYRYKYGGDRLGDLYLTDEDLADLTPPYTGVGRHNSVRLVAYGES